MEVQIEVKQTLFENRPNEKQKKKKNRKNMMTQEEDVQTKQNQSFSLAVARKFTLPFYSSFFFFFPT